MFGKLGDMAGMLKQAQEMQKNMGKMQELLAETEVRGKSICGRVEVVMTCDMHIRRVIIDDDCMNLLSADDMGKLVCDAFNSAMEAVKSVTKEKMNEVTGGLDIPGLA